MMFRLEQIASGLKCDMGIRYSFLAHNQAEWGRHWKQFFPKSDIMEYDFSEVSILGVGYGRSSTETLIRILHVEEHRNSLEVDVGYWVGSNKQVCQPYHLVRISPTKKSASFSYRKVGRIALRSFPKPRK